MARFQRDHEGRIVPPAPNAKSVKHTPIFAVDAGLPAWLRLATTSPVGTLVSDTMAKTSPSGTTPIPGWQGVQTGAASGNTGRIETVEGFAKLYNIGPRFDWIVRGLHTDVDLTGKGRITIGLGDGVAYGFKLQQDTSDTNAKLIYKPSGSAVTVDLPFNLKERHAEVALCWHLYSGDIAILAGSLEEDELGVVRAAAPISPEAGATLMRPFIEVATAEAVAHQVRYTEIELRAWTF